MSKGGKLVLLEGGPDEDLIDALETALREAKAGTIISGALLLQGPGGALRQDLAGPFHSGDLILQMKRLEIELLDIEFGDDDESPEPPDNNETDSDDNDDDDDDDDTKA